MDKVDGPDADKSDWIKLRFFIDPDNPASKYSQQLAIFKDGCPDDWIKWSMVFREIEKQMLLKEPADKTKICRTLLKGQALSYFEHHLRKRLKTEDSEPSDNDLIELVLRELHIGLEYIPKRAIHVQKYHMRQTSVINESLYVRTAICINIE
jgi:hypothetical protein